MGARQSYRSISETAPIVEMPPLNETPEEREARTKKEKQERLEKERLERIAKLEREE